MGTLKRYKNTFSSLNKPYDLFESKRNRLIISFSISGFVWFFLFIFGVFDFDYFSFSRRLYFTGVYSISCLVILLINSFLIQDLVIKELTLFKSIIWSLWFMFCIGVSNFALTTLVFKWEDVSLNVMLKNIAFTLFMGLIIAPVLMLVHYNYTLRKSVYELIQDKKFSPFPYSDEPEKESVRIQSDYKSDSLEIELNTILFIESSDNYLNVHYLKDEEIHHRFIRKTLSALEKSAIHPALIRCHRSYIINKNNVQSVKSNAGEYSLLIKYVRREIPVSRNYRNVVLTSIRV